MHKYKISDVVTFINSYGVNFGKKTITGLDNRNGPTYYITPTDTPWYSVEEEYLHLHKEVVNNAAKKLHH